MEIEQVILEGLFENPSVTLKEVYDAICRMPSDIHGHCHTLAHYAREYSHITELGTRWGTSAIAFLYGQPEHLITYDIKKYPTIDPIHRIAGRTEFFFRLESTLETTIEETDVLFIDTLHTYQQLKQELILHADKARHHIILHDTVTYADYGMNGEEGLRRAIEEFLADNPQWKLDIHYSHSNGLTILKRTLNLQKPKFQMV